MLDFRHKLGPGFLILIALLSFGAATILELVVSIGLPTIQGVYFLSFTLLNLGQTIRFGVWTICTDQYYSSFSFDDSGSTCQPTSLGYESTQFGQIADYLLIKSLSKALVIQPIACGFAGFATAACLLHLCSNFLIWPFITFIAGALGVLVFVFEIILFTTARVRLNSSSVESYFGQAISSSSLGPAIWIQLVAAVIVAFGALMSWTAYLARKARKTHTGTLGTRPKENAYDESRVVSPVQKEKSSKRRGLFAMAAPQALKGGNVGKGGFLSRLRRGQDEHEHGSEVAMRTLAAPLSGADKGESRSSSKDEERRASKGARVSRSYGRDEDFADIADRRRSRNSGNNHLLPTHSRRSSGAEAVGGRAAKTAAFASGTRSARGSMSGSSVKEAYSSRRNSAKDNSKRSRSRERRQSENSGDDVFHEAHDDEDRADLGYLLGSRPYSHPSGHQGGVVHRSRSRGPDGVEMRDLSRPRHRSEGHAVKRKAAPAMGRDGAYGSGGSRGETRSSGMTRHASEPLGDAEDVYISPRKGRRSARYSTRMAEEGWD